MRGVDDVEWVLGRGKITRSSHSSPFPTINRKITGADTKKEMAIQPA